jgi:organic hydroperoxide reductase OsmC/OhrA
MTEKVLFTGKTHNTNGRDGGARSSDGQLDLKLKQPHPAAENLFGAAWSACYMGAIEVAASQRHIKLPRVSRSMPRSI